MTIDRAPQPWTGRSDGPGREHARWHNIVQPWDGGSLSGIACLIGFSCDEGVRRNQGRVGAADGPRALRHALASLAARVEAIADAGDIVVSDDAVEAGQQRLADVVCDVLKSGGLPVVIGGGHEVAYGTHCGLALHNETLQTKDDAATRRLGIVNLDAHYDLRGDATPSSGTPFRQLAGEAARQGRPFSYAVAGISEANNTQALHDTARELGVRTLIDDDCTPHAITRFVAEACREHDRTHLSIDLDVLPASVAPGVSAPAGFGVSLESVRAAARAVVDSGTLAIIEVAELNPTYDIDGRTARTAARLIDDLVVRATRRYRVA